MNNHQPISNMCAESHVNLVKISDKFKLMFQEVEFLAEDPRLVFSEEALCCQPL